MAIAVAVDLATMVRCSHIARKEQTMCEIHAEHAGRGTEIAAPSIAGTTFAVSDMTCGHCVGTVRAAIERALPGAAVEINLDAHRVTVAGDAAIAAAAIRSAGYTPERVSA
jgi:copper chaperone